MGKGKGRGASKGGRGAKAATKAVAAAAAALNPAQAVIQAVATASASSTSGLALLTNVRAEAARLNPSMTHEQFNKTFNELSKKEVLAGHAHDFPRSASPELQKAMIPIPGESGRAIHAVDLRRGKTVAELLKRFAD